jgi:hypothetical protein
VNWTARVPLNGTPSSACAALGLRATVITVSAISRPGEIKPRFLFETRFRNIVIASVNRF